MQSSGCNCRSHFADKSPHGLLSRHGKRVQQLYNDAAESTFITSSSHFLFLALYTTNISFSLSSTTAAAAAAFPFSAAAAASTNVSVRPTKESQAAFVRCWDRAASSRCRDGHRADRRGHRAAQQHRRCIDGDNLSSISLHSLGDSFGCGVDRRSRG